MSTIAGLAERPLTINLAVFSKCSPAIEDGKRYENMAWRLWARGSFCCQPDHVVQPQWSLDQKAAAAATANVPELSTTVASDDSIEPLTTTRHRSDSFASRTDLRRHDSTTSNAYGKHITSIVIEKVVQSIQEKKVLEPMSPLPPHLAQATQEVRSEEAVAPCSASPPLTARRCAPELPTSTFATARGSDGLSATGSEASTSTDQISLRQYREAISNSEGATESDSDEPEESAIEEEDSGDDWEDDDEEANESHQSSIQTSSMFPRVDSKPDLASHRSLLTSMMQECDRAQAMQHAAQRQQPLPVLQSRTTAPKGPSNGNSLQEDSGLMMRQQASRAKPIVMTTSNVHPLALSPWTTRRLMLQNELTGSLRQNLLWERQQKNATTNAAMRRAATTTGLQGMSTVAKAHPMHTSAENPKSYFNQGLDSYHTKGW